MEDAVKLRKQLTRTRVVVFILAVTCVLFFVFAYVQKIEADRQYELAETQRNLSKQALAETQRQEVIAMQERSEAENQRDASRVLATATGESLETVEELKKELEAQRKIAEQNQAEAKRMEALAKQNEMMARAAEVSAKKALEECQKKKQ